MLTAESEGCDQPKHAADVPYPFQRHLHNLYQKHFEGKPSTRAPPIPTAFVDPPAAPEGMPLQLSNTSAVESCLRCEGYVSGGPH